MSKPICVSIDGSGYVFTTGGELGSQNCPYILMDSQNQIVELYPFNLTVDEGAQISVAILGAWAIAVVFRILIRMLF